MNPVVYYLKKFAEETPDKTALAAEDISVTYRELWKEVRGFASYLISSGIGKGERVVVKAFPTVGYGVACLGCHLAGCVFVPVEKNMGSEGIKNVICELSASLLVGDCDAGDNCAFLQSSDIRETAAKYFDDSLELPMPALDDVCDILFTTGTTGKSKGVVLTNKAVFAAVDNNAHIDELNGDSVYLVAAPVNHASGIRKFYSSITRGAAVVLLDGFMNLKKYYKAISDYKVTHLMVPPSAVRVLLTVSAKELEKYAEQIEVVHSGAAALPEADKEKLIKVLPKSRLIFGYGASEAGNTSAYDYAKYPGLENCIGKANPHTKILIVDDNGNEIRSSKDNLGLIAITGDAIMKEYYGEPALTAEVLRDGIFYTNDMGYIAEDGFVYMLGRKGDVINVGGLKIAPSEVENIALRYPGVFECACFGVPDKINGFVPKLNMVREYDKEIDLKDFREYLQKHLETFKIPRSIEFVDSLPKTSNGKLDRKKLI